MQTTIETDLWAADQWASAKCAFLDVMEPVAKLLKRELQVTARNEEELGFELDDFNLVITCDVVARKCIGRSRPAMAYTLTQWYVEDQGRWDPPTTEEHVIADKQPSILACVSAALAFVAKCEIDQCVQYVCESQQGDPLAEVEEM